MRPQVLQPSDHRPRKFCFGYKQKGHLLLECPQRDEHRRHFQFFCDIAYAAEYFLSYDEQELEQNAEEFLNYFADAKI